MNEPRSILDLQRKQLEHDKHHHRDIYALSYPAKTNHYVHHFSKYAGRLSNDDDELGGVQYPIEKTIADGLIVALAMANTLNIDLNSELESKADNIPKDVDKIGGTLLTSFGPDSSEDTQNWIFNEMAYSAGRMADAMESLDHMETLDVRAILEEETVHIVIALLVTSELFEKSPSRLVVERWQQIEEESIL